PVYRSASRRAALGIDEDRGASRSCRAGPETKSAPASSVSGSLVKTEAIRIGFTLHVMQVAGAEMLVAQTIRRLRPLIDPVVFCLDDVGQLGVRLQQDGVPVVALGRRPGIDFRVAFRLAKEIDGRKLDVIHAHQYTPFFYTALGRTVARRSVPIIFTEHGRHY